MDENKDKKKSDDIFYPDEPKVTYEAPSIVSETDEKAAETFADRLDGADKEPRLMYYENSVERQLYAEKLIREAREKSVKKTLVFSLLGLILSLFFGLGLAFSIVGLLRANFGLKKKGSQTLVWARTLGIVGIILSAAFIIAMFAYAVYVGYSRPDPT